MFAPSKPVILLLVRFAMSRVMVEGGRVSVKP